MLNSWLCGWIDWNLVLDDKGGPNHANNWCIAPVIARPESNEVYYTPLYYTLSHFSKYIRPGAYRIGQRGTHSGRWHHFRPVEPCLSVAEPLPGGPAVQL